MWQSQENRWHLRTFVCKRRHLDESQRSMVAAKLANMRHGGDRKSDQVANLQLDHVSQSAADLLNVSPRSVASAKKVLAGEPVELTRKDGEVVQLVVSTSPASEAQKGNRNAVKGKENDSPNLANGYSPQQDRANANGVSVAHQRTLDKIARLAPDYLPRIAAKEISINKAAIAAGLRKVQGGGQPYGA